VSRPGYSVADAAVGFTARPADELLIRLTDPGRRLLDDYAESVAALQGRMVRNFSPRQLDQFHSALAASYHALH
jgi:hypothetical protein